MGASDPYVDQFSGDIFWWTFLCFRKILSEWGVFLFLLEQNVYLKIETYTNLCENILYYTKYYLREEWKNWEFPSVEYIVSRCLPSMLKKMFLEVVKRIKNFVTCLQRKNKIM